MAGKEDIERRASEKEGPYTLRSGIAIAVAIVFVAAWIAGSVFLWFDVDASSEVWARRSGLIDAFQAIALSGAGVLLGLSTQRKATERAEAEADEAHAMAEEARERAEANDRSAEGGRAIATVAASKLASVTSAEPASKKKKDSELAGDLEEIVALAQRYGFDIHKEIDDT